MSNDTLISRIDLLQDQIYNLEKSGHFTEKEINSKSYPLVQELEILQKQFIDSCTNDSATPYGFEFHGLDYCKMAVAKIINTTVIDAEILTANSITA